MIAEYKGTNGRPAEIPPEVMRELHFRVLIGHAGKDRSSVLCRGYTWNTKNNRWTLEYALASARIYLKDKSQVFVSTLYESMVVIGHPMTIVPMKAQGTNGGAHDKS